jgi:hypothetical protein
LVPVDDTDWTQLTANDVSELSFQFQEGHLLYVAATNGETKPAAAFTGYQYGFQEGEALMSLADFFPGVSGANRVWARTANGSASVMVSHA